MNLTKMSLAAVVVVASLGTASVADVKISGKSDFRFKSVDFGAIDKFSRGRVDINLKSHSADKMGMLHIKVRHDGGKLGLNKLYAKYNAMGFMIGAGPKIGAQGKLSFTTNAGIVVTKKLAGIKFGGALLNEKGKSKQLFTAAGKISMLSFAVDYQMGDAKQYIATLAHAKFGPAKIGLGYAMDTAKSNTMMGASVNMKMGAMGFGAGGTISSMGGQIVERTSSTGIPAELGSYYGSQDAGMAFYANANINIMGHNIGAYGSFAGNKMEYQASLKKQINAQSKGQLYVTYQMSEEAPKLTTEVRLFTKF